MLFNARCLFLGPQCFGMRNVPFSPGGVASFPAQKVDTPTMFGTRIPFRDHGCRTKKLVACKAGFPTNTFVSTFCIVATAIFFSHICRCSNGTITCSWSPSCTFRGSTPRASTRYRVSLAEEHGASSRPDLLHSRDCSFFKRTMSFDMCCRGGERLKRRAKYVSEEQAASV